MSKSVNLSDSLVEEAKKYANVYHRSLGQQIEHWLKIGKIAEENPDLSYNFIKDILLGLEEKKLEEYKFDDNSSNQSL